MSREIKFRAWDRNDKRFVDETDPMRVIISLIWTEASSEFSVREWDNLTIEQFTGLHDKNGKEIYENDVVKGKICAKNSWDGYINKEALKDIRVVQFKESKWSLIQPEMKRETQGIKLSERTQNRFEVIGNIHENPELLEKV